MSSLLNVVTCAGVHRPLEGAAEWGKPRPTVSCSEGASWPHCDESKFSLFGLLFQLCCQWLFSKSPDPKSRDFHLQGIAMPTTGIISITSVNVSLWRIQICLWRLKLTLKGLSAEGAWEARGFVLMLLLGCVFLEHTWDQEEAGRSAKHGPLAWRDGKFTNTAPW